jgi:hypothetical protein
MSVPLCPGDLVLVEFVSVVRVNLCESTRAALTVGGFDETRGQTSGYGPQAWGAIPSIMWVGR